MADPGGESIAEGMAVLWASLLWAYQSGWERRTRAHQAHTHTPAFRWGGFPTSPLLAVPTIVLSLPPDAGNVTEFT